MCYIRRLRHVNLPDARFGLLNLTPRPRHDPDFGSLLRTLTTLIDDHNSSELDIFIVDQGREVGPGLGLTTLKPAWSGSRSG